MNFFSRADSRKVVWGIGLVISFSIWLLLIGLASPIWQAIQETSGDWIWRAKTITQTNAPERRLILVDIDEKSLQELGPWPWPRQRVAQLVTALGEQGASLQIFDVVFAEERPGDAQLAKAIVQHRPIFSEILALETPFTSSLGQLQGQLSWTQCPAPFQAASGYLANSPSLPVRAGHITPRLQVDGVLRHQPAIICFGNKAYPSLTLRSLMAMFGEEELRLERGGLLQSDWVLTGAKLLSNSVPLDAKGDIRFPWTFEKQQFISISAADVLSGRFPKQIFSNAVVLVGSTAFGLNDAITTPLAPLAAGMQAHAEMLLGFLDNGIPFTPRFDLYYQIFLMLSGLGVLMYFGKRSRASYLIPLIGIATALGCWLLFAVFLWQNQWWLSWVYPALFLLITSLILGLVEHARSRIDRDRLFEHLSSYLPSAVATSLVKQSPSNAIRAQNQLAVVMFADIRNFSSYCENRPPEESAAVLHAFFSSTTRIVEQYGGVIESFEGDALIAVWSDAKAIHDPAYLLQTIVSATKIIQDSTHFLPDPAPADLEPLALGIGIELGSVMSGSFGLAKRRTHLVLGPTVSIASCLVAMTAELSHPILIGESLAHAVKGVTLQPMGTFLLEGLKHSHQIYAYPIAPESLAIE